MNSMDVVQDNRAFLAGWRVVIPMLVPTEMSDRVDG